MDLRLEHCRMRDWRETDAAALATHADDRNVWINLRDLFPHPYTAEDARTWLAVAMARKPPTSFALEVEGQAVGGIGMKLGQDVHRHSAEIGFWLGEPYWGRGIMSEAVPAFSDHAFERFDLVRLFAAVFEWNPASMRVLEKAGFRREGCLRKSVYKDGRMIDTVLYARVHDRNSALCSSE